MPDPTITKKVTSPLPVVALIGRANVGKSTLFNRLIEEQKAIVSDMAGTTRTRNEGTVLWRGAEFKLVDTGGITLNEHVDFEDDIIKQAEKVLKEADIIVFVTDAKVGPVNEEIALAKRLRRVKIKPVIFVANKVDNKKVEATLTEPEWYRLGLGEPVAVSGSSGRGIGDFLDLIYTALQVRDTAAQDYEEPTGDHPIQVAIVGKPNVGKSSLFNKLIGEDKVIVSPIAHTTREPHDTLVSYRYDTNADLRLDDNGKEVDDGEIPVEEEEQLINFIDTAGIRRKSKVEGTLERQGIHKSIEVLEKSNLILFVIDGSETISQQDMQLGSLMERRSKSVIILVNKWDLAEENTDRQRAEVKKMLLTYFPHLDFAPIMFVSGKTGYHVHDIFPMIVRVWKARHREIANRGLEKFLAYIMKSHKPARGKGTRQPSIMGMRQINAAPPVFEIFIKYRTSLHRSYLNFIENKLREDFDFLGTPIVIKLTKMKK